MGIDKKKKKTTPYRTIKNNKNFPSAENEKNVWKSKIFLRNNEFCSYISIGFYTRTTYYTYKKYIVTVDEKKKIYTNVMFSNIYGSVVITRI